MGNTVLHAMIQPLGDVTRDLRRNFKWVFWLLFGAALWVLASACLIRLFENHWGFWHACYFTIINVTTVGFGDVVPATHAGKIIAGLNSIVGLLLFGTVVAALTIAFQPTGFSATLTSETSPEHAEQSANAKSKLIPHRTADVLDSIARLLRAAEKPGEYSEHPTDTRISIHSDRAEIEIRIHRRQ